LTLSNASLYLCLSVRLPLSLSLCLLIQLSVSLCRSVSQYIFLSFSLFLCLSIPLSLCLSVSQFICMSRSLFSSISLYSLWLYMKLCTKKFYLWSSVCGVVGISRRQFRRLVSRPIPVSVSGRSASGHAVRILIWDRDSGSVPNVDGGSGVAH
jgi:hypothetical protein